MDRDFDAAMSVLSGLPEGEQIRVGQRQYIPATLKGLTYLAARSIPEAKAVFEQVRETMVCDFEVTASRSRKGTRSQAVHLLFHEGGL